MKEKIKSTLKFMRRNRTFTKLLSFILSVVMVFYVIPSTIYAKAAELIDGMQASDSAAVGDIDSDSFNSESNTQFKGVLFEDVTLREESVKHFHLEDGNYVAAQYNYPIHTLDSNGEWQDIDNALSDMGNEFSNSNARIKFAKKINGSSELFALHDGNTKLTLTLLNANKGTVGEITNATDTGGDTELQKMMNLEKLSASIIYRDILDGVDLEYVAYSMNVKENIIVKEKKSTYSYSFELKLNGLTAIITDSGNIEIRSDDSNELMYVIPAPVVFDSNGEYAPSDLSSYTLTHKNGKKYILTVTVDSEWMNTEERAFPVTVDPAVMSGGATAIDVNINSSQPDLVNDSSTEITVMTGTYTTMLMHWKLPTLPAVPTSAKIVDAQITLVEKTIYGVYIGAYEILDDWDETLTWTKFDNNASPQGTLGKMVDYVYIQFPGAYTWNITELVQEWYRGNNFGVAFKCIPKANTMAYFHSANATSNRPSLVVTYRDMKGIESYWPTTSHSAGLAGNGTINLANGNLIFTIPTITTTDSIFSYTPTLVYDSSMSAKYYTDDNANIGITYAFLPYGFKLSLNETLRYYSTGDGDFYYVHSDPDGTEHIFNAVGDGTYRDEDGLDQVLTVQSDGDIIITDESKTIKLFDKVSHADFGTRWRLLYIQDISGNRLQFTYDESYTHLFMPLKVSLLPNGKSTAIDLLEFHYASGRLKMVYSPASHQAMVLRYSNTYNGDILSTGYAYLRQIDYAYGNASVTTANWNAFIADETVRPNITVYDSAKYSYNSQGYLTEAKVTSTSTSVKYSWNGYKISTVSEYADDECGQELGIVSNVRFAELRTTGNDEKLNTSDDILTRYTLDNYGRAISVYSCSSDGRTIYGATSGTYDAGNTNSLKHKAVIDGIAINQLLNGDFEELDDNNKLLHWTETSNVYRGDNFPQCDEGYNSATLRPSSTANASISQVVFLPAGSYTLSMSYVSRACENYEGKVTITSTSGSGIAHTESLSLNKDLTSIEKVAFSTSFEVLSFTGGGDYLEIKIALSCSAADNSSIFRIDNVMLCNSIGASDYSLISYGDFEATSLGADNTVIGLDNYWTNGNSAASPILYDTGITEFGKAVKVDITTNKNYVKQRIYQINDSDLLYYGTQDFYGNAYYDYIVSGFAYSPLAICNSNSHFRIRVDVYYYQGEGVTEVVKSHYFDFLPGIDGWQFVNGLFSTRYIPTNSSDTNKYNCVSAIDIYCEFNNQAYGYALFDNVSVIRTDYDNFVEYEYYTQGILAGKLAKKGNPTYTEYYAYDSNANLSVVATSEGNLVKYEYNSANQLVSVINCEYSYNGEYYFPIDQEDPYSSVTKYYKNKTEYTYDSYGNKRYIITSPLDLNSGDVVVGAKQIINFFTYDSSSTSPMFGALKSETDSSGVTIYYYYDSNTCRLKATVNSESGNGIGYKYDSKGQLISVVPAVYTSPVAFGTYVNAEKVEYTYGSDNMLEGISTKSTDYTFSYDKFGNRTSVTVGDNTLASYEYSENNGKLKKITYGNGLVVEYVYNALENLSEIWYTDGEDPAIKAYEYEYTANGLIQSVKDNLSGKQTVFTYDKRNQLSKIVSNSDDDMYNDLFTNVSYYDDGNLHKISTYIDLVDNTDYDDTYLAYFCNYNGPDNQLSRYNITNNYIHGGLAFTYDSLYRLSGEEIALESFGASYTYTYKDDGQYTTGQIQSVTTVINETETKSATYTYDADGNIIRIDYSDGTYVNYTYDKLSQLIKDNISFLEFSFDYTYDEAGNLTKVTRTANSTGSKSTIKTFTYTDSEWGDLLTIYNGTAITYDEIGNPIEYYNGSSYTFEWQGRRLISAERGSKAMSFTYNDEGLRTSKTVNGVTTNYYYQGSILYAEETNSQITVYIYDENGAPVGYMYRKASYGKDVWDVYAYEKNIQGDIVAVYDALTGTKLISYVYNSWGEFSIVYHNSGSSTTATKNPYKYRGYYYDNDLSLYYLQTRYYDAKTCRFISPDTSSVLTATPTALTDKNLFAYCDNNPVMRVDEDGEFWLELGIMVVGGLVGAVFNSIASALSQKAVTGDVDMKSVAVAAASGFVSGAVAASPLGILGQSIAGGVIGGLSYIANAYVTGQETSEDEIAVAVATGVISGMIGGKGFNHNYDISLPIYTTKIVRSYTSISYSSIEAAKITARAVITRNAIISKAAIVAVARYAIGSAFSNFTNDIYLNKIKNS